MKKDIVKQNQNRIFIAISVISVMVWAALLSFSSPSLVWVFIWFGWLIMGVSAVKKRYGLEELYSQSFTMSRAFSYSALVVLWPFIALLK